VTEPVLAATAAGMTLFMQRQVYGQPLETARIIYTSMDQKRDNKAVYHILNIASLDGAKEGCGLANEGDADHFFERFDVLFVVSAQRVHLVL
jgi:hypothetical protein